MPIAIVLFGAGAWGGSPVLGLAEFGAEWPRIQLNDHPERRLDFRGCAIALLLAIWRGLVADRQSKTAQESLLRDRFQKAVRDARKHCSSLSASVEYMPCKAWPSSILTSTTFRVMKQLCSFVQSSNLKLEGQPTVGHGRD